MNARTVEAASRRRVAYEAVLADQVRKLLKELPTSRYRPAGVRVGVVFFWQLEEEALAVFDGLTQVIPAVSECVALSDPCGVALAPLGPIECVENEGVEEVMPERALGDFVEQLIEVLHGRASPLLILAVPEQNIVGIGIGEAPQR
jgi:hypothetical protein